MVKKVRNTKEDTVVFFAGAGCSYPAICCRNAAI